MTGKRSMTRTLRCILVAQMLLLAAAGCVSTEKKASSASEAGTEKAEDNQNTSAADPAAAEKAAIVKRLAEALEEAKTSGKTSIDIYLDEDPDRIQTMDVVKVAYTARIEGGQDISGVNGLQTDASGRILETFIAGEHSKMPGLAVAVVGMGLEKQQVTIPPESAFGVREKSRLKTFPSVRTLPRFMGIKKQTYQDQFGSPPSLAERVMINPYFESQIIEVTDDHVRIENLAKDGLEENSPIGSTRIRVIDNLITITLEPQMGAIFVAGKDKGPIVSIGDQSFVVDFNHPLAGKSVIYDLEILDIAKPSLYRNLSISWVDDHDTGFDRAREEKKDKVLVLYADWCQWCEKMFKETFTDPRILLVKDRFVFVKANSDQDQSLKELYGQKGFPMIVLTDYKGKIYKKIKGFKDAQSLLNELELIMDPKLAEADEFH